MLLITPQYILSHPLFPSVEQHPSTDTHTHTHASRYLDRDALLSAAELLGVCVCICVCVNVFMVSPNRKEEVPSSSFLLYHVFFRGKWEKKNKKKSGQTHTMQGERERERENPYMTANELLLRHYGKRWRLIISKCVKALNSNNETELKIEHRPTCSWFPKDQVPLHWDSVPGHQTKFYFPWE